MDIEKTLRTFWICTNVESTGADADVCKPFCFREKLCNAHTFLSGMHLEYDVDEPGAPACLVFETWDVSEDELQPGYFQTGPLIALESIRNGFRAVTGDNEGKTTYTFKKSKINPFQAFVERHPNKKTKKQREADLQELRNAIISAKPVEC